MKRLFGLLAAVFIVSASFGQATPREKRSVRNDLVNERSKKADAAKDLFRGEPGRASADNRAAIRYHKNAVYKVQQIHRRHHTRRPMIHHRIHRRTHRVVVRH